MDAYLDQARVRLHWSLCRHILGYREGVITCADRANQRSRQIAEAMASLIASGASCPLQSLHLTEDAGKVFRNIVREFLEETLEHLGHIRPGPWQFFVEETISHFEPYTHLSELVALIKELSIANPQVRAFFSTGYLVTPDILIARLPWPDRDLNHFESLVGNYGRLSPFRKRFAEQPPILHASVSCKWTIRSDRAQNARTEALNLIRHRKGHTPHIVVVTAEPLPTRIASLALGTGDIDCVYHIALYELQRAVEQVGGEDQQSMLNDLVQGARLRDISDLPLDLAT